MASKALLLKGSCHCQAVKFHVHSCTPYPFLTCYCSMCRKLQGGQGGAINIMGDTKSFQVDEGAESLGIYRAKAEVQPGKLGYVDNLRHFCKQCGSHLWAWAPCYAEYIYPFASAIDTQLPTPPERVHLMLGSKASWVHVQDAKEDQHYDAYPPLGIEEWHKKHGLYLAQ